MTTAGFQYAYAGKNKTLTEEDKASKKDEFNAALDKFDEFLGQNKDAGPFALGSSVSGIDVEIVPVLERWRYQMPITNGMDITDGGRRKCIQRWYDAMDQFEPYINRVKGDEYSWTAVAAFFVRIFGNSGEDGLTDEMQEAINRAEAAADALTEKFTQPDEYPINTSFAIEAASKIIANHKAIVSDCTNAEPKSQKEVTRANDAHAADMVLRAVANNLLMQQTQSNGDSVLISPKFDSADQSKDAILSARTVATRLCVPRDMGGPAASVLRRELVKTADYIEKTLV